MTLQMRDQENIERGREEGRREGLLEGRKEGRKEGLLEGHKEGLLEGHRAGIYKMLFSLRRLRIPEAIIQEEISKAYQIPMEEAAQYMKEG